MPLKLLPALLAICIPCFSAVSNVQVVGVSNTQAIITYRAPDSNACNLAVSTSPTYSPLAHDVDPAIFTASDPSLDSRPGNVSLGTYRAFVVGARRADPETSTPAVLVSRALQVDTTYYFKITCDSTQTATGSFHTDTLRMGRTYADPPLISSASPGSYAWPTASLVDRTEQIVDPQTGVPIKHMTLPTDRVLQVGNQNVAMSAARSSAWSNPNNVLANDAASATIANSTGTLYISPENSPTSNSGYFSSFHAQHDVAGYAGFSLDWFQVTIQAASSNAACNSASPTTCEINVCLTTNGVSCYTGSSTYTQALTTTLTNYTFGTQNPVDLWQAASAAPPNGTDVAIAQGSVTCTGTTGITLASGDPFQPRWASGTDININGTDYLLAASISTTTTATLTTTCPSGSYSYYAADFGVLAWRTAANSDTISVQYASASFQLGVLPQFSDDGSYYQCSVATVTGNNGDPGYMCAILGNGAVYWVDSITGESHLLFLDQFSATQCGSWDTNPFDPVNPNVLYCGGNNPTSLTYVGNYLEPTNAYAGSSLLPTGEIQEQTNIPTCSGGPPPTNQPCLISRPLTGSTTLSALTQAFDPAFDPAAYASAGISYPYMSEVLPNGQMLFRLWRSSYGSIAWIVIFDPNATSNGQSGNAGCVLTSPGCVVAAMPSWNRPNFRWCPVKGNEYWGPGWISSDGFYWGGGTTPGMGPYQVNVTDGTAFTTGTGVPGGLNACPPNTLGVSGNLCTTVTVSGQPYDPNPCTASAAACFGEVESGAPGALGAAAPGDYFVTPSNETLRLIAISGLQWSFQRGWDFGGVTYTTGVNPTLTATCNCSGGPSEQQPGSDTFWNYFADPHGYNLYGSTILDDTQGVNAHAGIEINNATSGQYIISNTFDPRCPYLGVYYYCYEDRLYTASNIAALATTPATIFSQQNPFFAGKYGPAQGNQTQEHPAGPGRSSAAPLNQFGWDGRPFNGGPLSGSQPYDGNYPAANIAGQLWRFPAATAAMDRKFLPTFAFNGRMPLVDVSGPSSSICASSSCSYEYCVTVLAGECYSGSSAGDVYVNAPIVDYPYCHNPTQVTVLSDQFDICVGNSSAVYDALMQFGLWKTDGSGAYTRMLSKGLAINRLMAPFYHPEALANGRWIISETNYINNVTDEVLLFKVPSIPAPDSIDRGDFIPIPVTVTPPSSLSVANAFVEFGYAENSPGNPGNFYCTSRAETCAVGQATNANTINETTPFYFETSEAGSLAGTSCSSNCTIAIPAISGRVLYYRVVYRNSGGSKVAVGPTSVAVIP